MKRRGDEEEGRHEEEGRVGVIAYGLFCVPEPMRKAEGDRLGRAVDGCGRPGGA